MKILSDIGVIILNFLDIFIVFILLYQLFRLINNTRAIQMLRGLIFFFVITMVAGFMNLSVVEWIFRSIWKISLIVVVVIFQPEIRSMLAEIGKRRLFERRLQINFKKAILEALNYFQDMKIGALIVIERNTGLKEYVETGVILNARISSELLKTIFTPKTDLHDGAVILQKNVIASAASVLPLSKQDFDTTIGTRHRAGVGISEVSDALVIIVSEETGNIAVAEDGGLKWKVSLEDLEEMLEKIYTNNEQYFRKIIKRMLKPDNLKKNMKEKLIAGIVAFLVWYYIKFMNLG